MRLMRVQGGPAPAAGLLLLIVSLVSISVVLLAFLDPPEVQVAPQMRDLGESEVGRNVMCDYKVFNNTEEWVTLIGADNSCRLVGCRWTDQTPLMLRPGERRELNVAFKRFQPGPFADVLTIYTDSHATPAIYLRVKGVAVAELSRPSK